MFGPLYDPDATDPSGGGDPVPAPAAPAPEPEATPASPGSAVTLQPGQIAVDESEYKRQTGRASSLQSFTDKLGNLGINADNIEQYAPGLTRLKDDPALLAALSPDAEPQTPPAESDDFDTRFEREWQKRTTEDATASYNSSVNVERDMVNSVLKSEAFAHIFKGIEPAEGETVLNTAYKGGENVSKSQQAFAMLIDTAMYEFADKYPDGHPLSGRAVPMDQEKMQSAVNFVFESLQELNRSAILQGSRGLSIAPTAPPVAASEAPTDHRQLPLPNSQQVQEFATRRMKEHRAAGTPASV